MRPVHTIYYVRIGAIAQLGERLHGMQEVDGSIRPLAGFFALQLRQALPSYLIDKRKTEQLK